jgi:excinuclease UvrABC ATPase subunit
VEHIRIRGARENNLQNVSLDIPKGKITVFTGVSGSGKSSLVFDTLATESQRLINETFSTFVQNFLPKYSQPDADSLENLSPTIVVDQQRMGGNARSTVGTITDTYTMLRVLFSRHGQPPRGTAHMFSFNDPQGMCPDCEGLGRVSTVDLDALLDRSKSLREGAIRFPTFQVDSWFWNIFAHSGFFDVDKKLADYSEDEWNKLVHLPETKVKLGVGGSTINSSYEGLLPKFKRLYLSKDAEQMSPNMRSLFEKVVTRTVCGRCRGARLNESILECRIAGKNIAQCSAMQLSELAAFVRDIAAPHVAPVLTALAARLDHFVYIGLGYLSLDRETSTLSGGESQRVKMVRHLGSSLTGMVYVFDEPSIGLHPHDIQRLNELLVQLRDKGNTVLVVEHKPVIMAIADHIVDMGPGAGRHGGQVVFQGTLDGLRASNTKTGRCLGHRQPVKTAVREPTGHIAVEHATLHNLHDVSVQIPEGVLVAVTGVAGSGKSSLIHGVLPQQHPETIVVDQGLTAGSRRSNLATYSGMLDPVRKAFAQANRVSPGLFSANSKGACPHCQGLGVVYTDLAHMDTVAVTCEVCEGRRFTDEVLGYKLRDKNISEVLRMSVLEASEFFTERAVKPIVAALRDVGLGYLQLGQPLNTLSGGERQRLKLAGELGSTSKIYVLDEPTTGLHMSDVDHLVGLLDRLVDNGSTVIVIEHNLDVIARADWVIDLGPGAGHEGGQIVYEGPPQGLMQDERSLTGRHLRLRG